MTTPQTLSDCPSADDRRKLDAAMAFTKAHRDTAGVHKALREAACLREQIPAMLDRIHDDDLFAGRCSDDGSLVKFTVHGYGGGQAGYCVDLARLRRMKQDAGSSCDAMIDSLLDYWSHESAMARNNRLWASDGGMTRYIDNETATAPGSGGILKYRGIRLVGIFLDYDKLLTLGIPGLIGELRTRMAAVGNTGGDIVLCEAMLSALDTFKVACGHYAEEARSRSAAATLDPHKRDLGEMAATLDRIAVAPPQSLREAIQLVWLYGIVTGARDFPRMDVCLGDFYARDIDSGRLSAQDAQRLILGFWKAIDDAHSLVNGRVFIGGMGRRNEAHADRFAMAAMDATRTFKRIHPVLTLRFYRGQNPALMQKALDVIGDGCLYPTLYNDDVYVPGIQRIMGVPFDDAVKYLPLGCGEMCLDHTSIGPPNIAFNIPKALEAALHNGREAGTGRCVGLETGSLDRFDTFERLVHAFKEQLANAVRVAAQSAACEYVTYRDDCAFLYASILMDDCVQRCRALADGGIRYTGGCAEGFGFTNAADSLVAIRELVYQQRAMSLHKLVEILDADFEGFAAERARMLAVPKYGNDQPEPDAMLADISGFIHRIAREEGMEAGLDYFVVSSVNPGGIAYGHQSSATADGRRKGEPFAIGNSPTAGFDKSGITALLNSVARSDAANGGYITNLKLSREMFTQYRGALDALMGTFFDKGGMQLNITVLNRGDLESAMKEPEKYPHVLVRLGGWSARFIDLDRATQMEILRRTLY